jgi:hypothetical protein
VESVPAVIGLAADGLVEDRRTGRDPLLNLLLVFWRELRDMQYFGFNLFPIRHPALQKPLSVQFRLLCEREASLARIRCCNCL